VGLAIAAYHEAGPTSGGASTTARSATASNSSDTGATFTLALKPLVVAVVPIGFNAYDTGTAAGAASGFIQTKVSGSLVTLHAVALKAGPAIETGYVGTVHAELLNASD